MHLRHYPFGNRITIDNGDGNRSKTLIEACPKIYISVDNRAKYKKKIEKRKHVKQSKINDMLVVEY